MAFVVLQVGQLGNFEWFKGKIRGKTAVHCHSSPRLLLVEPVHLVQLGLG